mmetsp:Transcript_15252/g.35778  ORF Transcript_15252/g.35778 Transcript_15252/m.35778 type:complete len:122 (+) Transcript_15252:697-1062(+)
MPDGWLPPLMPVLLAHGCLSKEPKASFTPQPVLDNEPPKPMTQKEIKQVIRDKKREFGEVGEGGSGGGRDESDMAKRTKALTHLLVLSCSLTCSLTHPLAHSNTDTHSLSSLSLPHTHDAS